MKETFYFSHDYNARTDDKIKKLIRKYGVQGYGLYWFIIEDLYNNANALHLDYEGIAFDYRVEEEIVRSLIEDYELFIIDGDKFYSKSVKDRLDKRDEKSAKARENANKRWSKNNANALLSQCKPNAIKESKVKESKVNKKYIGDKSHGDIKIELDKFINYWNQTFNEQRRVTGDLVNAYAIIRKKYSKEDLGVGANKYFKEKKDTEKQYLLSPIKFFKQTNGLASYL